MVVLNPEKDQANKRREKRARMLLNCISVESMINAIIILIIMQPSQSMIVILTDFILL